MPTSISTGRSTGMIFWRGSGISAARAGRRFGRGMRRGTGMWMGMIWGCGGRGLGKERSQGQIRGVRESGVRGSEPQGVSPGSLEAGDGVLGWRLAATRSRRSGARGEGVRGQGSGVRGEGSGFRVQGSEGSGALAGRQWHTGAGRVGETLPRAISSLRHGGSAIGETRLRRRVSPKLAVRRFGETRQQLRRGVGRGLGGVRRQRGRPLVTASPR